jgi:outer membrane lipoprotein-sorting protein
MISLGQSAVDIIKKVEQTMRGNSNYSELKMTIVRPDWTREMTMKSWAKGEDYALQTIEGRDCYVVQLTPKEGVPVVWGSIKFWIDKKDYLQMKSEFYDEDEYLVSTIAFSQIKNMGGRPIPTVLTVTPAEDEENKTIIEYLSLEFNKKYEDSFFTIQNMKRIN